MSPPTRSNIWNYFSVIDADSAMCNICFNAYSRKGRTTTSLKNHLKAVHHEEYQAYLKSEEDKVAVIEKTTKPSILIPIQEMHEEASVSEPLETSTQFNKIDLKVEEVDRYVGEMIALQDLPFDFVNELGFRRLMQHVVPEYCLGGALHFKNVVCDLLYEKLAIKIHGIVDGLNYKSFTVGTWSDSSSNVSFLTFICHSITENFDRVRIVLKCESFDKRHTGDIISEKLRLLQDEWKISKSLIHCIIRDEGSNIRRSMIQSSFDDVDCAVHKLQIAVQAGLNCCQNLIELIEKCKQIGTQFYHVSNQTISNVFQDSTLRWNSTCCMFESLLDIKDILSDYCVHKPVPILSAEEWKIIETCVLVLKPFEEANRELSDSSTCISSVIPIVYTLTRMLNEYVNTTKEPNWTVQIISTIRECLSKQFSDLEYSFLFTIATYLDPRYKHKFFAPNIKTNVEAEIIRLCCLNSNQPVSKKRKISSAINLPGQSSAFPTSETKNETSNVLKTMASYLDSSSEDEEDNEQKIKIELSNYLKKKRANISENPLTWWRTKLGVSDQIRGLVQRYLSPPAASTSTECLLTQDRKINGSLRSRLTVEKAAKLLFLKYNLPLVNFEY